MRGAASHATRGGLAVAVALAAAATAGAAGGMAHAQHHRPTPFGVSAALGVPLTPGHVQRLDLRIRNPQPFALRVNLLQVAVSVDGAHDHAGCDRLGNFHTTAMPPSAFPLRVPAHSTWSLSRLGVASRLWPRLVLLDRAVNQNACQGARLSLRFTGRAGRWRDR